MVTNPAKMAVIGDEVIAQMANELSDSLFSAAPVNIDLTDNKFKLVRTLHYTKQSPTAGHGKKTTSGNIEVYAKDGISDELALKLASFINQADNSSSPKSFQAMKDGDDYIVKMVTSPQTMGTVDDQTYSAMAELFSKNVFDGGKLVFELTDNQFRTLKSFPYPAPGSPNE